jgi:hypothetical protein
VALLFPCIICTCPLAVCPSAQRTDLGALGCLKLEIPFQADPHLDRAPPTGEVCVPLPRHSPFCHNTTPCKAMTECVGGEDPAQLDSGTSGPPEDRTRLALWIPNVLDNKEVFLYACALRQPPRAVRKPPWRTRAKKLPYYRVDSVSLALSVAWNCPGLWLPPIPWFWPSKQSSLRILWNLVMVNTGLGIAEGVDIYFACWDTEVSGV